MTSSTTPETMNSKDKPFYEAIFTKLKSRNWTATFRDINSFADPKKFSKPQNGAEAWIRLEANINYYLTNYVVLCAFIIVYAILSKPLLVVVIFLLGLLWYYMLKHPEVRIPVHSSLQQLAGTHTLTLKGQQKLIVTGVATALVVLVTAGTTIFMVAGICAFVVAMHAAFHAAEESGDDLDQSNFNFNESGTLTSIGHSHIDDLESGALFQTDNSIPSLSPHGNEQEKYDMDDNPSRRLGKQAIEMTSMEVSRK